MDKIVSLTQKTDVEIWLDFRNGDRQAFSRIFHAYYNCLYHYGIKFCTDKDLTKDCIQELFIYLWENREKLGDTTSIKFYLMKCYRRRIGKILNKNKLSISANALPENYEFEILFSHEEELIEEQIFSDREAHLLHAFNDLSKRQKEVLYLKFYCNLDYQEIAEVMSINYQSVRNQVHQAIAALRKKILLISLLALFAVLAAL